MQKALHKPIVDENYVDGLKRSYDLSRELKAGLETPLGAAIYAALENIERASYNTLATTSPWRKAKLIKAQSELRTAQYIKAFLEHYIKNEEVFAEQLGEIYGNDREA